MTAPTEVIGYVIVDVVTKAIDWDCELHLTPEAAIAALTGPLHMYCKSVEQESEDKTYWKRDYMICAVAEGA